MILEQHFMCKILYMSNLLALAFLWTKKNALIHCILSEAHKSSILILNVFQTAAFSSN